MQISIKVIVLLFVITIYGCGVRHYYQHHVLNLEKEVYYKIDLPEEYDLISKNINKPDTMLGFISNDTIYFRFKH